MTFTYEDKLMMSDFEFSYREKMVEITKEHIRMDEELMKEIKEFCEEENADDVEGKLSMQDYINLKIDEMAEEAVSKIRIYCEFDVEVEVK